MNIKPGKREVKALAEVLDGEYETVEQAAEAALIKAWELYEQRAKFTVVGQLYYSDGYVHPDEPRASKVALGWYATEKQAETAAQSMVYSAQTHEEFRVWVLPVHHGTPAEFYKQRKAERERLAMEARKGHSKLEEWLARNSKPREDDKEDDNG